MPHEDRSTLVRLVGFAGIWIVAFFFFLQRRDPAQTWTKLGLLIVAIVPTVLVFFLVQRFAKHKIPWFIELFALPFVAGGLLFAYAFVRGAIRGGA